MWEEVQEMSQSSCKFCGASITWISIDGKNKPMNLDNTQHKCQTQGTQAKTEAKTSTVTLECKIANLKAFIDLCKASGLTPEEWPACAGVWNATK